jgi:hypothetical protein
MALWSILIYAERSLPIWPRPPSRVGPAGSARRPMDRWRQISLGLRKRRTTGMKKGMEESYVEDLASHDGPAHALAFREGAAKRW